MKFEGSGSKGTRVIERKRSVTDGQTDKAKTRSPPEGGGGVHCENNIRPGHSAQVFED